MANTLQLVLTVDNRPGNQAINQFNRSLSSIEQQALRSSQGASRALAPRGPSAMTAITTTIARIMRFIFNLVGSRAILTPFMPGMFRR